MKTLAEIQNNYGFYDKLTPTKFTLNGIYPEHTITKSFPSLFDEEWQVIPNTIDVFIPFFIKINDKKYITEMLFTELYKSYTDGNLYFTLDNILGVEINVEAQYKYVQDKFKDKLEAASVTNFKNHSYDGAKMVDYDILNQFLFLFSKNKDRVRATYKVAAMFNANGEPTAAFPANVSPSKAARDKIRNVDQYLVDTLASNTTQTSTISNVVPISTTPAPKPTILQSLFGGIRSLFGG